MLPANRHLLPVLGIDIHMVIILGAPVPIPHPFIGLVFDPFDWIPKIGATVKVNGMPRGNAGTDGMLAIRVHIPMGGPFAMAPTIGHDSKNFFGSPRVKAEGSYFSGAGFMVMSCNDVGIPLSITPGKKFKPIPSLYLPTSVAIPIPMGRPVIVGGPYVPDLMGMIMGLVMSFGFGALMKIGGKALKKGLTALNQKVLKKFKCTQSLSRKFCKHGFEPVNLINGSVLYEGVDFELPGPIPIRWERNWYSDSGYEGPLGHGTHLCYDLTLLVMEAERGIGVMLPDGRATAFPLLADGEDFYNRGEKLTLTCRDRRNYELFDHTTRLRYIFEWRMDNLFKPVAIMNEAGLSMSLHYNRKHVLEKIVDTAGRQLLITLDEQGRMVKVEGRHKGAHRIFVEYGYNEAGDLAAITDAYGNTTSMRFEHHLLVAKTDRNGQTFYWEYDGAGTGARCVHTWGEGGILEGTIEYRSGYNVVTNSLGEKQWYYYDENGLCIQETDALGNSVFQEYTAAPELYRDIDEEGNITGYVYDGRGNRTARQNPDGSVVSYLYDEAGRLQMVTDAAGNATVYVYKDHLLHAVVAPDRAVTSYTYDAHGRMHTIENNKGEKTLVEYDDEHNLVSMTLPGGACSRWGYDEWGRCILAVNPEGRSQTFAYDLLSRLVRVRLHDGNRVQLRYNAYDDLVYIEDMYRKCVFEYTPTGRIAYTGDSGNGLRYLYNTADRLVALINEKQEKYRFQYNSRGDLVRETGFDGQSKEYTRDSAGRIIRVDRPGNRSSTYEYDLGGRIIRAEHSDGTWDVFTYDRKGDLVEAINEYHTVTLQRDTAGRVIRETQDSYAVESLYDALGRRIQISSNLGAAIQLSHNEAGLVSRVQAVNKEGTRWEAAIQYNLLGLEMERWLPGGVMKGMQYDAAGRPLEQGIVRGNRRIRHRIYSWNVSDRLLSMMNGLTRGLVQYGYDEFSNLAWASYEDKQSDYRAPDKTRNLYRSKDQDDRQYGPGGQLRKAGTARYEYDETGNLISKLTAKGQQWRYEWQDNGLLRKVIRPSGNAVTFEYDALGRRTAKICDGYITRWVWDGNVLLHEWKYPLGARPSAVIDEWGEVRQEKEEPTVDVVTWVFDEDTFAPAARLKGDDCYSIITDYLGMPVEMTDAAGQQVWSVDYDIYGKIRKQYTGTGASCPFRWQGQYEDAETGLYYNRYRYYDPVDGVYISQDPIGLAGGAELYGYVHDPNMCVDPWGLHEAFAWLNGQAVPDSKGKYNWYSDRGSSKNPFNGYGSKGHSEAKLLEHLDQQHAAGKVNLTGSKLEITSMGQMTRGGTNSLSTLAPCPNCDKGLDAFARKHEMEILYHFEDENGVKQTVKFPKCG